MRKLALLTLLTLSLFTLALPLRAADQITYISQPDEVYIFLNDIAFARDEITLPPGVDAVVTLPTYVFANTLVIREQGQRVSTYRLQNTGSNLIIRWETAAADSARQVTLEYLLSGLSWTPRFDMWLAADTASTVDLSFFAEITNAALDLDTVTTHLIAGRVDTAQQINTVSQITANQYIAGYEESSAAAGEVGAATIQYIYDIGQVTAAQGETIYQSQFDGTLPARRLLLWNASADQQATVIYKVRNESALPFPEGIVRSYQNGYFIGSDFVETTPISSEGSITVGKLQDVRVNRAETQTALTGVFYSRQHHVELTLTNFSADPVEIEVVDYQNLYAEDLTFSSEPVRETGNLLRWMTTIAPGETVTITYDYKTR